MSVMNVQAFEKVYGEQPTPINNHILVEVVDKDTTRKTSGGILLDETHITGDTNPFLIVLDIGADLKTNKYNIQVGDVVTPVAGQILFFYGKDMKKLGLLHVDRIAGVYHKPEGKKIPYSKEKKEDTPKDSKVIVPGNNGGSRIILAD